MSLIAGRTFPMFRTCFRNMSKVLPEGKISSEAKISPEAKIFARRQYYGEPGPKPPSFLQEAGLGKDNITYWFLYFTKYYGWNFHRQPGYISLSKELRYIIELLFQKSGSFYHLPLYSDSKTFENIYGREAFSEIKMFDNCEK